MKTLEYLIEFLTAKKIQILRDFRKNDITYIDISRKKGKFKSFDIDSQHSFIYEKGYFDAILQMRDIIVKKGFFQQAVQHKNYSEIMQILKIIEEEIEETEKILQHYEITLDEIINNKERLFEFESEEQLKFATDAGYLLQARAIKERIQVLFPTLSGKGRRSRNQMKKFLEQASNADCLDSAVDLNKVKAKYQNLKKGESI